MKFIRAFEATVGDYTLITMPHESFVRGVKIIKNERPHNGDCHQRLLVEGGIVHYKMQSVILIPYDVVIPVFKEDEIAL